MHDTKPVPFASSTVTGEESSTCGGRLKWTRYGATGGTGELSDEMLVAQLLISEATISDDAFKTVQDRTCRRADENRTSDMKPEPSDGFPKKGKTAPRLRGTYSRTKSPVHIIGPNFGISL
jgi:hypothetical protein